MNDINDVVKRDLHGKAEGFELERLRQTPTTWRDVLVGLKQDVESHLVRRAADATAKENDCFRTGTKDDWFDYRAEYETWRAGAIHFKTQVEKRIRYVNGLLRQEAGSRGETARGETMNRLARLEAKLDQLLERANHAA